MMDDQATGEVSYEPPPGSSGTQSAAVVSPTVKERQRAWILRIELMAKTLARLFNVEGEVIEDAVSAGVGTMLVLLNILTYQHALENMFGHKCLSLELVGCLATSPEPGLPMPPKFFVGSGKSSTFGAEGVDIEDFTQ